MKKYLIIAIMFLITISCSEAFQDRYSKEYLQNKKHVSIINPLVENYVKKEIKKSLKKQTGNDFEVVFAGYTVSSIKKGIFKTLEISSENLKIENVPIPYINIKTLTDYNYIDYTKNPIVYKSDMTFAYKLDLSEQSINEALKNKKYQKTINKINKLAYPLFNLTNVSIKIAENKLYLVMDYNFPIARASQDRTFIASTELEVKDGKIQAKNVQVDKIYGDLGLNRVAYLINLLNPLEYTLSLIDSKECKAKIENINIIDNIIHIDGKMFVKADVNENS